MPVCSDSVKGIFNKNWLASTNLERPADHRNLTEVWLGHSAENWDLN
jgi:hypothetical protein